MSHVCMPEDVSQRDVIKKLLVIKMSSEAAGQYHGKNRERQQGQAEVKLANSTWQKAVGKGQTHEPMAEAMRKGQSFLSCLPHDTISV